MKKKLLEAISTKDFVGREYVEKSYNAKFKKGDVITHVYGDMVLVHEITEIDKEKIDPGIYTVRESSYTAFIVPRKLLIEPNASGVESTDISNKVKIFLDKADFFVSRGLIPKRGALLHGPPGCGKTHSINLCVKNLIGKNGVAMYVSMDSVRIDSFVSMLEKQEFNSSVDKLFIIIEDLGGGEMTDQKKGFLIPASSNLLGLLDGNLLPNKKIPTVILSTTNYPKNFLENILDRPGRFDEVIEFSLPSGEAALAYAKSLDIPITDFDARSLLKGGIGLAHIKEAVVRYGVYGEAVHNTLDMMRKRTEKITKQLTDKLDPYS